MHAWILRDFTNTLSVNFKTVRITHYTFLIPWKQIEENQESQTKALLWPSGWEMTPLFLAQVGPPSITTILLFQHKQDMKLLLSRPVTKSVVINFWKQTDLWLWTHLYVRDTCILRQNILTLTRMVVVKGLFHAGILPTVTLAELDAPQYFSLVETLTGKPTPLPLHWTTFVQFLPQPNDFPSACTRTDRTSRTCLP